MPRKTLSFAMVLLIFNSPFLILAQENSDAAQAVMDARKDVKLSRTGEYWAFGTFLTSICMRVYWWFYYSYQLTTLYTYTTNK